MNYIHICRMIYECHLSTVFNLKYTQEAQFSSCCMGTMLGPRRYIGYRKMVMGIKLTKSTGINSTTNNKYLSLMGSMDTFFVFCRFV